MEVSIIVPTYNMGDYVDKTLKFLANQFIESDFAYEVVVVDDGSEDNTKTIVSNYNQVLKHLQYIYLPRNSLSSRARTRNIGVENSSGKILVFLDSGVIVPPSFVNTVYKRFLENNSLTLFHYVFGHFVPFKQEELKKLDGIEPNNIEDYAQKLKEFPDWKDERDGIFTVINDNIQVLGAPWVYGWTHCLSTSAETFREIKGFDENFLTWGGEDIDLCYRLKQGGTEFGFDRDAYAIHIPHPSSELPQDKVISSRNNVKKFHEKYFTIDSEVFSVIKKGHTVNRFLARLNVLSLEQTLPKIPDNTISILKNDYLNGSNLSLLSGPIDLDLIKGLGTTHVITPNNVIYKQLTTCYAENVSCFIGFNTPFENGLFDSVIATDYMRLFSSSVFTLILKELIRISKKLILIFSLDVFIGDKSKSFDQWIDFTSANKLVREALETTNKIMKVKNCGTHVIIEL